ncbi:hypothetical protein [Hoeflea poritis]|uniref:Portal protein n=1 Tax=Hoeflea poritis TaxID=2993659 RepID=A0ABT4VMN3_9HYPH|nr:hypothetical protein [Hoeflea poritis]MDA4845941.1 hypothetical protein [Hoeflea poritis]
MFDLEADDGSVRVKPAHEPQPAVNDNATEKKPHRLDSGRMVRLKNRLLDHYEREIDRQRENRLEMALDAAFYDNNQWREEDLVTLKERGQVPLVYNVIATSVDWVTGTERRARTDFKVLPRRKDQGEPAQRKTQLLKYLSDVNRSPFDRSRAFEDAVKVGIGWIEDGWEPDSTKEPLYSRHESWRNILFDSSANELDLSDARYIFRSKWVDLDVAIALFPERRGALEQSAETDSSYLQLDYYGDDVMDEKEESLDEHDYSYAHNRMGFERRRVRLIEAWYRTPEKYDRLRGGTFSGETFDEHSPGHREELDRGEAELRKSVGMRMRVAIFTSSALLYEGPSPYRHNTFPFTPVWGHRRDKDGLPYGMIRRLRSIQEDINKRASKALHILSTNKTIMDDDALADDMTVEEYLDEVSRPDAVIRKKRGSELTINADRDLSQYELDYMSRSISLVQSASGVTDENLGRKTNAVSGIAIERRQDQGSLATSLYFDNLRFANQLQGEKQLSNVEQFMSDKKAFRITDERGKPDFVDVNDGLPENDIIRSKADFIIDEADWQSTLRQAAVAELLGLLQTMPAEIGMTLLDLVVEEMDLRNREEIVKRIRQVNGQNDPDAEEDSEDAIRQKEAQAAEQEFNAAMSQAALEKAMGEAREAMARAEKIAAEARQVQGREVADTINAQNTALDAAAKVVAHPAVADIADHITHEAGLVSRTDKERQAAGIATLPAPHQTPPETIPLAG